MSDSNKEDWGGWRRIPLDERGNCLACGSYAHGYSKLLVKARERAALAHNEKPPKSIGPRCSAKTRKGHPCTMAAATRCGLCRTHASGAWDRYAMRDAASGRPPPISPSTPPAPDLPRAMLRFLRDGYGPGGGYYEPDQRLAAAVSLLECGWGSERTAAQRPPDPAAPDLRGLLREAAQMLRYGPSWALSGNPWVSRRTSLLARIDAALDEKQVGAAPHSTTTGNQK